MLVKHETDFGFAGVADAFNWPFHFLVEGGVDEVEIVGSGELEVRSFVAEVAENDAHGIAVSAVTVDGHELDKVMVSEAVDDLANAFVEAIEAVAEGSREGHMVERSSEPDTRGEEADVGAFGGDFSGGGAGEECIGAEGEVRAMLFDGAHGNENDGALTVERIYILPGELAELHFIGWDRGR